MFILTMSLVYQEPHIGPKAWLSTTASRPNLES